MLPLYAYLVGDISAAAPTVSAVSPNVADTAGGGGVVTITGANLTGATGVTLGGTAATSVTVVNSTTVTCVPGARASGASLSVVVTTPGGSNGANTLFEYWTPAQMTGIGGYYDANKSASVSSWADQSSTAGAATQATGARQPVITSSAFGSLPGVTFAAVKGMALASRRTQASGRSVFFVAKWTSSDATATDYAGNPPLTVVGDATNSVAGAVGASAGALHYADANNTANSASRGSGYNDGSPRLLGWTHTNDGAGLGTARAYAGSTLVGTTAAILYPAGWGWNAIGAGYINGVDPIGDSFVGTLGAVVVVDQVAAAGDMTKLYAWAQQRFGVL